ncbi:MULTISPECIES: ParA family protein [unclassified Haladaptatus]|uniref:ParA family protein n=1 Tax=unclassified Haladaptatus TaxID=2622732 RepID=UPI0023E8B5F4|nr:MULTISPECIES: ParA family protein [unclassified Haladaptatus]
MLAVAGGKGSCGKTTTTLGLARALARHGHDVVAVDTDTAMPNLHAVADVDREPGLPALERGATLQAASHPLPEDPASPNRTRRQTGRGAQPQQGALAPAGRGMHASRLSGGCGERGGYAASPRKRSSFRRAIRRVSVTPPKPPPWPERSTRPPLA